jgi:hypothetical protein
MARADPHGAQPIAFTVNLAHSRFRDHDPTGCAPLTRRLQQQLSKALRDYLGLVPEFFFLLDHTDAGRPHLHGAMLVSASDLGRAKRALLRVGGRALVKGFRARQVLMKPCDAGWVDSYLAPKLRGLDHSHARARIACSRKLGGAARLHYHESTRT